MKLCTIYHFVNFVIFFVDFVVKPYIIKRNFALCTLN